MRALYLFVAGIFVGLAVQMAVAQNQNTGIVGLNHVAISVPDIDEAITYYTQTIGLTEAFRVTNDSGQPTLVYIHVSQNTFLELSPANDQRPPGINHLGIEVEDMASAVAMFRERGADVTDPRSGSTGAILANITSPNGIRIELGELAAGSRQREAIDGWQ